MAGGRHAKELVDTVRDLSFQARKDEHLLDRREALPWPRLESFRRRFRAAKTPEARRKISLELQHKLREQNALDELIGNLRKRMNDLGRAGTYQQLERFFPEFFKHQSGPLHGKPFHLAPFQAEFLREFWRREGGRRTYTRGLWGIPKGNGKSPTAAVLGMHALLERDDRPEVYAIAGSKDQAGICHEFAYRNVKSGALRGWVDAGQGYLRCGATGGEFEIMSSDGDLAQGVVTSAAIVDELWLFQHRKQREAYEAQVRALHKRAPNSWVLAITTAGFTKQSLLGEMFDDALKHPALEVLNDGYLLELRDPESGFFMRWYGAPDDADIEDPATVRRANPAPWVDSSEILRALHAPGTDEYAWRRLNLNQWTKVKGQWLSPGAWNGLADAEIEIPRGAYVFVGVDIAHSYDTSAVAWAWVMPDGPIVVRTHVWSVREDAPAHEHVDDFYVEEGDREVHVAELFIRELGKRYRIKEVVADPNYFGAELRNLGRRFRSAPIFPASPEMSRAVQEFYTAVEAGRIRHDGDKVLAAHVAGVAGQKTSSGDWRIRKLDNPNPIDACVATIIARSRAELGGERRTPLIAAGTR